MAITVENKLGSQVFVGVAGDRGDITFSDSRTSDPTSPSEGNAWYNTTDNALRLRVGGSTTTYLGGQYGPHFVQGTFLLSEGIATIDRGRCIFQAQDGTTDDLVTINGSPTQKNGDTIIITAAAGDTITVKHNTGNVHLDGSADKALVNGNQFLLLFDGTDWTQLTPMMVLL